MEYFKKYRKVQYEEANLTTFTCVKVVKFAFS